MAKNPNSNSRPLAPTAAAMNKMPIDRPRVAEVQKGMLIAKKYGRSGADPATAMHRKGILEPQGARHRIEVKLPGPEAPEARATQANGKLMPSTMGQARNFEGGRGSYR